MTQRIGRRACALVAALPLTLLAASAGAGPAGHWTQLTHSHTGSIANLGLARAKDGTLHVFSAGPNRAPFSTIFDTPISAGGAVGKSQAILSGWSNVHPPAAVTAPDGSIYVIVSGQKTSSDVDPTAGLNELVGPGNWQLGAHAFGNASITVASDANVRTAALKNGQLVSTWATAAKLLFQAGVDPSVQPQDITPANDTIGAAEIAVDQASDAVVVAYHGVSSGGDYLRLVLPSLGAPQTIPGAKADPPSLAARSGGGVYAAYVEGAGVRLLRFGGQARAVPVPKGTEVATAGVAPGPEGRLWIFYGNPQQTFATRTSKAVGGFEPVQSFKSPPGAIQYFRLEGEGSAGPLDLFADVTVDGQTKDGSYATHVLPELSVSASKKHVKKKVQLTVRVTDAGDPVQGAKVSGLPGGPKTTDAKGTVVVTAARKGTVTLTATKAGYVAAKGRVST